MYLSTVLTRQSEVGRVEGSIVGRAIPERGRLLELLLRSGLELLLGWGLELLLLGARS